MDLTGSDGILQFPLLYHELCVLEEIQVPGVIPMQMGDDYHLDLARRNAQLCQLIGDALLLCLRVGHLGFADRLRAAAVQHDLVLSVGDVESKHRISEGDAGLIMQPDPLTWPGDVAKVQRVDFKFSHR